MTIHMFRVCIGRGPMALSDLETRINDWVASNPEWTEDTVEHTLKEGNTETDGSGSTYYSVDVRFLEDETKANLLQKLTDKIEQKVGWYRVGYHSCPHDGTSHTATESKQLSPDTEVTLGRIPIEQTVTIGNGEYVEGEDYTLAAKTLIIPDDTSIPVGEYDIEYSTNQCEWNDSTEWAVKDVNIPSGVPEFLP